MDLDALLRPLAAQQAPWLLALAIAVLAGVAWWRFARAVSWVERRVSSASALVAQTEGQSAFRQRFGQVFRELADDPALGARWRAFAATLVPVPDEAGGALGYTRRPQEDLDDRLLAGAGIDLRFYQAFPNLLVGLGLLLTFLGLMAALHFAAAGVAAPDVSTAQASLRDLLGAAAFKFITSIAGIACSLAFSWAEKSRLHRFRREVARLNGLLEARLQPLTAERLLVRQIEETRHARKVVERLAKGVFVRVPQGAEERVLERLDAAMAPLSASVGKAAAGLERLDERVAERLADRLAVEPAPRVGATAVPSAPEAVTPNKGSDAPIEHSDGPSAKLAPQAWRRLDQRLGAVGIAVARGLSLLGDEGGSRRTRRGGKRGEAQQALDALKAVEARVAEARTTLRGAQASAFEASPGGNDDALARALSEVEGALEESQERLREARLAPPAGAG